MPALVALALQIAPVSDHVTALRWMPIASVILPVLLLVGIWWYGSRHTV